MFMHIEYQYWLSLFLRKSFKNSGQWLLQKLIANQGVIRPRRRIILLKGDGVSPFSLLLSCSLALALALLRSCALAPKDVSNRALALLLLKM